MCSAYEIVECYRRAEEAGRMAKAALTPGERADLVEVEKRWLSLARNCKCNGQSKENGNEEVRRPRQSNHSPRRKLR
jgi:hypothetical protein